MVHLKFAFKIKFGEEQLALKSGLLVHYYLHSSGCALENGSSMFQDADKINMDELFCQLLISFGLFFLKAEALNSFSPYV